MLNITFLDSNALNPGDIDWGELSRLGNFRQYPRTSPEQLEERAADADILIINKVHIGEAELQRLPRLCCICVAATGYDVIDTKACRAHGVVVTNCANYSTKAVAQHIVALLLEVTNQVGHFARDVKEGRWARSLDFCYWDTSIVELEGRTATLIGYGNIGKATARLLAALGMNVCVVTSKAQGELPEGVCKISLHEAFRESDVVALCCPCTPENMQFVNASLLADCNPRLILINTARGRLVNEVDVADALREGRLGAYCADVLAVEPATSDNPLVSAPRTWLTPHVAWAAVEARQRLLNLLIDNIKAFIAGQPINVVN